MNGEMCTDAGRSKRERKLQDQRASTFQQINRKRDLIGLSTDHTWFN